MALSQGICLLNYGTILTPLTPSPHLSYLILIHQLRPPVSNSLFLLHVYNPGQQLTGSILPASLGAL